MLTALKAVMWRLLPFVILVVAGCGVQIEIAPTPIPSPFPHPMQHPGVAANGLSRSVATPRIVFSDKAQAQVFISPGSPDVYLLKDRPLTLSVDYDATWFESAQGQGNIRLTVYTRAVPAQGWVIYDSAERTVSTAAVPANVHDSLMVVVGSQTGGRVEIRAEVTVAANHSNGSDARQAGAAEFTAIVLSRPGDIKPDFAAMKPAIGELDPSVVLTDWRGWIGSPCALAPGATDDPGYPDVQVSCNAAAANNPEQVMKSIAAALAKARKPDLIARLNDLLGLANMTQKNFGEAALHFANAVSAWESAGRAWELTVSLHNLSCARVMQGDGASAFILFVELQELHAQYSDEAGQMLAQANMALVSGDKNALRQAHTYFQANGLPQAAVTDVWLRQLEGKP
jgi:hypothetical protein